MEEGQPPHLAPPDIKPCWVTTSFGRLPGLLLEWRRRDGGFYGRVVHPVPDEDVELATRDGGSGWIVVEEWLPAEMLSPGEQATPAPPGQRGRGAGGADA